MSARRSEGSLQVRVVHILISGKPSEDELTQERHQAVMTILAGALVFNHIPRQSR